MVNRAYSHSLGATVLNPIKPVGKGEANGMAKLKEGIMKGQERNYPPSLIDIKAVERTGMDPQFLNTKFENMIDSLTPRYLEHKKLTSEIGISKPPVVAFQEETNETEEDPRRQWAENLLSKSFYNLLSLKKMLMKMLKMPEKFGQMLQGELQ